MAQNGPVDPLQGPHAEAPLKWITCLEYQPPSFFALTIIPAYCFGVEEGDPHVNKEVMFWEIQYG